MADVAPSMNPRAWIAGLGIMGFLASLLVSFLTIGGVVLAVGVWKGNLDVRVTAVETASKEQIAALKDSAEKQVQAVLTAAKEMVAGLEKSTDKRLTDIETDRRAKIDEYQRSRAQDEARAAKQDTLLANQQKQIENQQKQIDFLVELAGGARRPPR